jgi:hypothetical protein
VEGDETKRQAFLSALIRVIKRTARHSFANSLYLPDYRAIDSVHNIRAVRTRLAIVGNTVLQNARNWAIESGLNVNDILFVF